MTHNLMVRTHHLISCTDDFYQMLWEVTLDIHKCGGLLKSLNLFELVDLPTWSPQMHIVFSYRMSHVFSGRGGLGFFQCLCLTVLIW